VKKFAHWNGSFGLDPWAGCQFMEHVVAPFRCGFPMPRRLMRQGRSLALSMREYPAAHPGLAVWSALGPAS